MNTIVVLMDSLNRHMLSTYGGEIKTPNLDRIAQRSVVFDNHFVGSVPCMPARRSLMTGRDEFFWRPWGPLEPFDYPIALAARNAGAVTSIVTDHYHYWEYAAHGYFEHFDSAHLIRGHELDNHITDKIDDVPIWAKSIDKYRPGWGSRYYNNVKDKSNESDYFAPKTINTACEWLDTNKDHDKFMLWLECFDAHEPFHIPEPYRSMYMDNPPEDGNYWPPYQDGYHGHNDKYWAEATEDDIKFVRSQYMGKVSMIDSWLGSLLERMDKYNLWDNTMLVVTTDHGHELGEKERFGKQPPQYDLSAHIPLFIYHPDVESRRVDAFTTAVDIYPTLIDALGGDSSPSPHGRSLIPLIKNETQTHRKAVVYGTFGCGATITNSDYTYHSGWNTSSPLYSYTSTMLWPSPDAVSGKFIPGVNCPVWKMPQTSDRPYEPLLFDRKNDPQQENNILNEKPEVVQEMRELLRAVMREVGVPEEQYDRLNLNI